MQLREAPEQSPQRPVSELWKWPLLFVCTMTVPSIITQRYSGYFEPGLEGHGSQRSLATQ